MNTKPATLDFGAAQKILSRGGRMLVSGHINPDGDALGSMLALSAMLCNAGYDAVPCADINQLGAPGFLELAHNLVPLKKLKKKKFDMLVAVDCATRERLPAEVKATAEKLPVLCIDHHLTNDSTAEVSLIDPDASSTGEIIWRMAKWMRWKFDRDIAEALWVALITDSGRFAYDSTRPETLRAATDLLKYDVRTAYINDILFSSFKRKTINLKQLAWKSLRIWKDYRVAEVSLSKKDFREVRGTKADIEDAVEIPRSVARNLIALFFYELPGRTKETKVSIRTRSPWDATAIAAKFGGGGHLHASGCTIMANLPEARRLMRRAVKEYLSGPRPQTPPSV